MVKKILALNVAIVLFCFLSACTVGTEQSSDAPTTSTVETEQPSGVPTTSTVETEQPAAVPVDYAMFCGNYSDTETVEGPCYTVSIISVDNAARTIEISVSYVGINSSPVYTTEPIHTSIADDHTVQFEWTDSWTNQGIGTLVLDPDNPSVVQLMMTVTKEAEVNRATLSTHDQYKTLLRRDD